MLDSCSSSLSKKPKISINHDFIPQEIIEEILTRLPVKSLLRFRCVSKPWLSLISSPRFVKTHLKISSNFPRVMLSFSYTSHRVKHCSAHSLISEPVTEVIDIYYPETDPNRRVHQSAWIVGSCSGLVCSSCDYFIWNPCTRIYKNLPPVNVDEINEWTDEFGYNAVDDDYKVLCLRIKTGQLEVNIYSLRTNSWGNRVCINAGISVRSELSFFAGKIHISTCDAGLNVGDVISFDLENDGYGIIEQPDYGEGVEALFLQELEGCFCVVCTKETHADLWVMKEYGVKKSWAKILTVPFLDDPLKAEYIKPLIMLPSGEILVAFEARFEVYNLKDNCVRLLETSNIGRFVAADVFVESLVSPTQHDRMGIQED